MSSTQAAEVRDEIAHADPALAILSEADLKWIQLVALLPISVVDDCDAGELQFLGVLHVLERGLAN